MTGAEIPAAKIKALREALARDGEVTFKNGSKVRLLHHERVEEGEDTRVIPFIEVERPAGGIARYAEHEIIAAYAMAIVGPQTKPFHPTNRDTDRFGDEAPW